MEMPEKEANIVVRKNSRAFCDNSKIEFKSISSTNDSLLLNADVWKQLQLQETVLYSNNKIPSEQKVHSPTDERHQKCTFFFRNVVINATWNNDKAEFSHWFHAGTYASVANFFVLSFGLLRCTGENKRKDISLFFLF